MVRAETVIANGERDAPCCGLGGQSVAKGGGRVAKSTRRPRAPAISSLRRPVANVDRCVLPSMPRSLPAPARRKDFLTSAVP